METKDAIVDMANKLLIERGYNAFSYKNISKEIGIKTSSIHYHFPVKTDLGIAVIKLHQQALEHTIGKTAGKTAVEKLGILFSYYKKLVEADKVCIVGALTSDINTLEDPLRIELIAFANSVVDWAADILHEGKEQNTFYPVKDIALKAKLLIANLMAIVQVARIEKDSKSFDSMSGMLFEEIVR